MRILIAGDWHSELHEEVVQRALLRLGHEVFGFKWHIYFDPAGSSLLPRNILRRAQNKYLIGPALKRLNDDFLTRVETLRPELIFIYRGTHLHAATIRAIKAQYPQTIVVGYNNDDPFAPNQPRYLWRHFLAAVPIYDLVLAYRHHNLAEFTAAGAQRVELMRSWYVPARNHPVVLDAAEREMYDCDVVFVGHYEPDHRLECLEAIVRQGFRLRLFGPAKYWQKPLASSSVLRQFASVQMVLGEEYNRALCGAKVALCFLSKLNRDTYTRRCFEIPATGTMMLSEYTDDLAGLYRAGTEADYFHNVGELLEKLELYVHDEARRREVAAMGLRRVAADGHDVDSRMRQLIKWVEEIDVSK